MPEVSWRNDPVVAGGSDAEAVLPGDGETREVDSHAATDVGAVSGAAMVAVPDMREDAPLPTFAGKHVDQARLRMTSATVEATDVHDIDDIVRVVLEGRVTSVDHRVNETTGDLIRLHTVKILEVEQIEKVVAPGMSVVVNE